MSGIEGAKTGKLLYHLTKIENFRSIVHYGLLPRQSVVDNGLTYENVADLNIIERRVEMGLGQYVPFHFHPYSAFDVAVKNNYDAQRMIYICIYRDFAREEGFKILPEHPLHMDDYRLYDYDEGYERIDWDTLTRKNDTSDYAREVKMAECLAGRPVMLDEFSAVFVPNEEIYEEVKKIMDDENISSEMRPAIYVQPIWFDNYD